MGKLSKSLNNSRVVMFYTPVTSNGSSSPCSKSSSRLLESSVSGRSPCCSASAAYPFIIWRNSFTNSSHSGVGMLPGQSGPYLRENLSIWYCRVTLKSPFIAGLICYTYDTLRPSQVATNFETLSTPMSKYLRSFSIQIQRLPKDSAATAVVPLPAQLSKITSPGLV